MQDENPEFINDVQGERRQVIIDYIDRRWKQLHTLLVDISERASKQLFITNGAGAISLMTYFGVVVKTPEKFFMEMRIAFCFFVIGIMLSMVVTAILFLRSNSLITSWNIDAGKFYDNKISLAALCKLDEDRVKQGGELAAILCSFCSFACFILGSMSTLTVVIYGRSAF